MGEMPKISVITVSFNAASTIERTILSVISQNYPRLEYILVDGNSTDNTVEIAGKYRRKFEVFISEKDYGISDAFNKGLKYATGDIIGIINADDWYEPLTFSLIARNYNRGDIFHGQIQYWRNGTKDYLAGGDHSYLKSEMTLHHPTVFVKKWVYERYGVFRLDYKHAMDYELMLRFYSKGVKFYYIPSVLANMSFMGTSDLNWTNAIKESKKAKILNGLSPVDAQLYFFKQIIRTFTARFMQKAGLLVFLSYYRKNFALIRKTIHS